MGTPPVTSANSTVTEFPIKPFAWGLADKINTMPMSEIKKLSVSFKLRCVKKLCFRFGERGLLFSPNNRIIAVKRLLYSAPLAMIEQATADHLYIFSEVVPDFVISIIREQYLNNGNTKLLKRMATAYPGFSDQEYEFEHTDKDKLCSSITESRGIRDVNNWLLIGGLYALSQNTYVSLRKEVLNSSGAKTAPKVTEKGSLASIKATKTTPTDTAEKQKPNFGSSSFYSIIAPNLSAAFDVTPKTLTLFSSEINKVANSKSGAQLANELRLALEKAVIGESQCNLWDIAINLTCNNDGTENKIRALQLVAVLLQGLELPEDNSIIPIGQRLALKRCCTIINEIPSNNIHLYPQGIDLQRNAFYHFYATAYAAAKMKQQGINDVDAFLYLLAFKTEYEIETIRLHHAYKNLDIRKPKLLDIINIEDLYLSYRGALFGTGLTCAPLTFEEFERRISRDGWRKAITTIATSAVADRSMPSESMPNQ